MGELAIDFKVLRVEPGDRWVIQPREPMDQTAMELLAEVVVGLGARWGIEIVLLDHGLDLTVMREGEIPNVVP